MKIKLVFLFCLNFFVISCHTEKEKQIVDVNSIKVIHLSLDDVSDAFNDLKENDYTNIFEQPLFGYLKKIHNKYDIKITLYLFHHNNNFHITDVPLRYRNDFKSNSSWLKMGFHSVSPQFEAELSDVTNFENSLKETYEAINKFAGPESVSLVIRLHGYYATAEMISVLKHNKIKGLLTADDNRGSYTLPAELEDILTNKSVVSYDSILYYKTTNRLENLNFFNPIEPLKIQGDTLVIFTHERFLKDQDFREISYSLIHNKNENHLNRTKLNKILEWVKNNNYQYTFFE